LHQKADDGNGKLARGLETHLPPPASIDDWHWATSLNQARGVALGIEHFRSWSPVCMGTVVWQLNDIWPAISWSAIDSAARRKPLWYALRRSFSDRLLTVQPRDGGLALIAVNDSGEAWTEHVILTRRTTKGAVIDSTVVAVDVAPRCTLTLPIAPELAAAAGKPGELLLAEAGAHRAWWHSCEDVDAGLPALDFTASAEQTPGGYRLTVTANAFVRDLALLADRLAADATVDDMLISLLPGESAVFAITTSAELSLEQLTDPLVLRSANQLVAG